MKIFVLGGGDSPEREVSLRSASSVAAAGRQAGFEVQEFDPAEGLKFLDQVSPKDIVMPILHGAGGEDGTIQAEFEKRGLAFLGAGSQSSKECFDKNITRKILQAAGLPVALGDLATKDSYENHELAKAPHVLKVSRGGSSIGTLIVRQSGASPEANKLFELDDQAVIESLIEGVEVTVPILDRVALPVIEIKPPQDGEFDYENKYNGKSQELCPPLSLSNAKQKEVQKLAEAVHSTMSCRHLSRVDIIVQPDSELIVLEINTIPGMTDQSLYPKSAAVSGLTMPELITKFVEMVKRDYSI